MDSYLLAEETFFYGAVLHHSFEAKIKNSPHHAAVIGLNQFVLNQKVPMKGGSISHSYIKTYDGENHDPASIINPFYNSVSGNTRRYVDNTLAAYDTNNSTKPIK